MTIIEANEKVTTSPTHLFMLFVGILAFVLVRWLATGWVGCFRLRSVRVCFVLQKWEKFVSSSSSLPFVASLTCWLFMELRRSKQSMQTRCCFEPDGNKNFLGEQGPHTTAPQLRQWCRRISIVNWVFLQHMQTLASESGTQTAAWSSERFLPPG